MNKLRNLRNLREELGRLLQQNRRNNNKIQALREEIKLRENRARNRVMRNLIAANQAYANQIPRIAHFEIVGLGDGVYGEGEIINRVVERGTWQHYGNMNVHMKFLGTLGPFKNRNGKEQQALGRRGGYINYRNKIWRVSPSLNSSEISHVNRTISTDGNIESMLKSRSSNVIALMDKLMKADGYEPDGGIINTKNEEKYSRKYKFQRLYKKVSFPNVI